MQRKLEPMGEIALAIATEQGMRESFRKAFLKAKAEFKPVIKDQENPFFKSTYADLGSYLHACEKALNSNGFALHQTFESDGTTNYLVTRLTHIDGWTELSRIAIRTKDDTDPQKVGSCISYLRRYSIAAILGVATSDDDGNSAAGGDIRESKQNTITEAQIKRLFAIAKNAGRTEQDIREVLTHFRYEHTRDITRTDYDLIIAALEKRQ